MSSLTLRGAHAVWSADVEGVHDVHIVDGSISSQPAQPAERIDVTGCVVTPGLVNAHHHLMQSAFRTLPGTRGVSMAEWLPTMAAAYTEARIDESLTYAAARAGIAESLLCGVTMVADHHLNWAGAKDTVSVAAGVVRASRELGARVAFVRGSAGDDPDAAAASADKIAAEFAPDVGGVSADGGVQIAVGPAGVHSDGEAMFRALADVATDRGLRRRTQANEQVDTAVALERYGRRPLELLDDWGWLEPDVTIAHACDVTDDEIGLLASRGVSVTHAPGCDVPMGWGIAPVHKLRQAGIEVGMGTSGGGSNDAGHLLADARLAMQVSGLVGPALDARSILAAATAGSARGLGRHELATLEVGSTADVCVWDVSTITDAGTADPVAGLLWLNPGRRPRHVIVGGRFVVRDYALVTGDEHEIRAALRARTGR
ncbi:amidohydrolase family protein [Microbacterium amylolyticum]|uniref:Cytosine/adenosine deaminase-related metal-dependent hydrolase n=1 Tax=Microbacterium amylolyticum TaxID=936337 RepID=A0ABS4ZLF4_9MICO|nr:amidohydrolase family protein [Microbacterium amylolyticum]MBP2437281.1 cytosine/adenosine deaminase-related metal-dependent hydrolase [Microbacterium amylolyticum]